MNKRPILLDTFCGAGGCTRGYQRAGFYVVGVDNRPQRNYCGEEFIQADALEFIAERGREFDVIRASPPCQAYSLGAARWKHQNEYPDVIAATRDILRKAGKPYIIENVRDAPLMASLLLCGTMFRLRVIRHRYFEIEPVRLFWVTPCQHNGSVKDGDFVTCAGHGGDGSNAYAVWCEAMGIDWMTKDELSQAIPPAYTEWIGRRLLEVWEGFR